MAVHIFDSIGSRGLETGNQFRRRDSRRGV